MNKLWVVSALAISSAMNAFADGSYFSGEIQQAKSKDLDECQSGQNCDLDPTGIRIAYGYAFNKYLALEAGYMQSDSFEIRYRESDFFWSFHSNIEFEAKTIDVSLLASIPFSESVSLFSRIGLAHTRVENEAMQAGMFRQWNEAFIAYQSSTTTTNDVIYGVGMAFGWFRVGYDVLKDVEAKIFSTELSTDIERVYTGVALSF